MIILNANLKFKAMPPRVTRKRTGITVHHTAGNPKQSVLGVHNGHLAIPTWLGVGYHYLQDHECNWWEGRPADRQGSHATSYNDIEWGVCVIGNWDIAEMPAARYASLLDLLEWKCRENAFTAYAVRGHKELPGARTACPGRFLHLGNMRRDLNVRLERTIHVVPSVDWAYRVIVDNVVKGVYRTPQKAFDLAVGVEAKHIEALRIPLT